MLTKLDVASLCSTKHMLCSGLIENFAWDFLCLPLDAFNTALDLRLSL